MYMDVALTQLQAKWISTWINEGVHNNEIVFPTSVYQNVSYSYAVSTDHPTDPEHSIVGYGMGWFRSSYRGHDVRSWISLSLESDG